MYKRSLLLVMSFFIAASAWAQTTVRITNADLVAGQDYNWTKNNIYVLDDMVFVKPGSKLFIQEGTVIKGALGDGNDATGLVVTMGAQIFAEGTAEEPIIFTSEADDLNGSLTELDRGLWGGLVVLGDAPTNNATEDGTKLIEGVNEMTKDSKVHTSSGLLSKAQVMPMTVMAVRLSRMVQQEMRIRLHLLDQ
ncbi:MAG: hypothetical protein EBR32_05205 [Bacteroidetes bacterium]|nr:hypothetical protein [Bacteroidota bacterium]